MRRILSICLALLLLTGCVSTPAETTAPTAAPTTVPTEPITEPIPTEDPADSIRTGFYLLTGITDGETSFDGLEMAAFRGYLQINPDRTGLLSLDGVVEHVEWTGRYLTINGTTCKFTIEDDVMTLNYKYQYETEFTYCGDELLDYYRSASLEPGMYLLTHYVEDDEIWYFDSPDLTLGYIHLQPDGTGVYFSGEQEFPLSWKNDILISSSCPLTYKFLPADQTEDGVPTLILYNLGYEMVIFRAVDDKTSEEI